MFSPRSSADHWAHWLLVALLFAPFALFAVLGRPMAVLRAFTTELPAFVLAGLLVAEFTLAGVTQPTGQNLGEA